MDKRRSCANCGSADHHVAYCTTYKQGMKSLGYAPDEEDMSQMEEHEYYSDLIIKIGARCFFCNQERHFRWSCDSGLGTLVLGQWSWDSGLGTVVMRQ